MNYLIKKHTGKKVEEPLTWGQRLAEATNSILARSKANRVSNK